MYSAPISQSMDIYIYLSLSLSLSQSNTNCLNFQYHNISIDPTRSTSDMSSVHKFLKFPRVFFFQFYLPVTQLTCLSCKKRGAKHNIEHPARCLLAQWLQTCIMENS